MKLLLFFIFAVSFQAFASEADAQNRKITLEFNNNNLKEVLSMIEDQSEFSFLYKDDQVSTDRDITSSFTGQKVNEILDDVLVDEDLEYHIKGKVILIASKEDMSSINSAPQQKKITGKVVDNSGDPIPGATVMVKGSTNGALTDIDGNYQLANIAKGATVVFSYIGLTTKEVVITNQTKIDITMEADNIGLDEIVVVGYGTTSRKEFTGSVSSLKLEDSPVANIPNMNALESLKGNITGLNIGASNTAGGQPSMLIRGQNSINGSNDPLVVLDGVIFLGTIGDINPNDIASYDILKDAVSSAAYGSRSANGVIAITTKKGKSRKPVVTFNATYGTQVWQNQPVMMEGEEWLSVANARSGYEEGTTNWLEIPELENYEAGKETVWLDQVVQLGTIQDYQLSVSGAGEGLNYYLSSSYNANSGVIIGDDFERISVMGKVNTDITSWLKIGVDGSFSMRDYSGFSASLTNAKKMSPYGNVYRDDEGNLEKYPITQSRINPLWGVDDGTRDNVSIAKSYRLNSYLVVKAPFLKGLSYRLNYLTDLKNSETGNFYYESYYVAEGDDIERYDPSTIVNFLSSANGSIATSETASYVVDNILNYKGKFGKHSVEATAVATRDYKNYEYISSSGSDFTANGNTSLGLSGLHKATVQKVNLSNSETSNIGYLARGNYSFDEKYFFTGSFRKDGASVFGVDNKWATFGAAGLAWRVTEEEFTSDLDFLSDLKLKASWGQNGNQGISAYTTLSKIANGNSSGLRYEFSDAEGVIEYGLYQSTLGNQELGWESTNAFNLGFESAWLNNRLFVDVDLYYSNTTDQIFNRSIPVMTGFKTITTSMGKVNNQGIDVTVKSVNIQNRDLNWSTSVTYWKNRNKLVELYGEDSDGDGVEDDDVSSSLFIGKSLGAIYGYVQDGIVQEDDTEYIELMGAVPGTPKYKDIDGVAGITADDRQILGYSSANFRLNMSNSVSYKGFDFYVMIAGVFGGDNRYLASNTSALLTGTSDGAGTNTISKPYWTSENPSDLYPSATFTGNDGRYKALQSRGFVRLQDISTSYTFNKKQWLKAASIKSLNVFFAAKNIATITNWDGGDPETAETYTSGTFPVMSSYSVGAKISF